MEGLERTPVLRRRMLYPAEIYVGPLVIQASIRIFPNNRSVSFPVRPQPVFVHRGRYTRKAYKTFPLLPILPSSPSSPHLLEAGIALPEFLPGETHLFRCFQGMPRPLEIGIPASSLTELLPVIFDSLGGSKNNVGMPKMFFGNSGIVSRSRPLLESFDFFHHPFQLVVMRCHMHLVPEPAGLKPTKMAS